MSGNISSEAGSGTSKQYLAHLERDETGEISVVQLLLDHLLETARLAAENGKAIHCFYIGFLLGVLHDAGKALEKFLDCLFGKSRTRVNHSSAGAIFLSRKLAELKECLKARNMALSSNYFDLLYYPILAHHGLFDVIGEGHNIPGDYISRIEDRMVEVDAHGQRLLEQETLDFIERELAPAVQKELGITLDELIIKAVLELQDLLELIKSMCHNGRDSEEKGLYYQKMRAYEGFLVRLFLSLLKTADCFDSATCCSKQKIVPLSQEKLEEVFKTFRERTERRAMYFVEHADGQVLNLVRTQLSELAQKHARSQVSGISQLDLPTGAGKTETSLRYAVNNQVELQKRGRLFYMAPYLSVTEQNGADIKKVVGENFVLEHHSNVVWPEENSLLDETECDQALYMPRSYVVDYWDAAVVVTTMVQFYQTLFGGRADNICRFSKLINGTIIIDEVQSLPIEHIGCFNLMLNFLAKVMNANILLCTATQPPLDHPSLRFSLDYSGQKKVIPPFLPGDPMYPNLTVFERSRVYPAWLYGPEFMAADNLLQRMAEELKTANSALCILNTKRAVQLIYERAKEAFPEAVVIYLTTNLCAAHRLDCIETMCEKLRFFRNLDSNTGLEHPDQKLICVTTSLIEAGVNVDFDLVLRSITGAESIEQARGRCNREGLLKTGGKVLVFRLKEDNTDQKGLWDVYQRGMITISQIDLQTSKSRKKTVATDGLDMKALTKAYYQKYYLEEADKTVLPLPKLRTNAIQLLTVNDSRFRALKDPKHFSAKHRLRQAFKTAAEEMKLIDQEMIGGIVPYRNDEVLRELIQMLDQREFSRVKILLRQLQRYTVNVPRWKDIAPYCSFVSKEMGIYIFHSGNYDEVCGLKIEDEEIKALIF